MKYGCRKCRREGVKLFLKGEKCFSPKCPITRRPYAPGEHGPSLFTKLSELGVRPYYIFHCDLVKGIEHFIAPIEKEIKIMTKLRKNLSGIAFPFHVIDAPNGSGKIPAPLNFWNFNTSNFTDFLEKKIKMY